MNSYSEIIRNHKEMIPSSLLEYISENFTYSKLSSGKLIIGTHVQPYTEEVSFYFDSSNRITVRFQFFDNLEEFLDDIEIAFSGTAFALKQQVQISLSELERVLEISNGSLEYSHHLSRIYGWWDIVLPNGKVDLEILQYLFTFVNEILEILKLTEKEVYCD